MTRYVAYYRVSTIKQGLSGLGLEAQRAAVLDFTRACGLLGEFTEIESGRRTDRPELSRALAACRLHGAVLVVAKLDRLARDAHFLLGLRDAGIEFQCCDMPSANRLTVGIMAMVAEEEARMISARTRSALSMAKARGVRLGNPGNLTVERKELGRSRAAEARRCQARERAADRLPYILAARESGIESLSGIAAYLNRRGIPTVKGGEWSSEQVRRVIAQCDAVSAT